MSHKNPLENRPFEIKTLDKGRPGPNHATAVIAQSFDKLGQKESKVIINIFMGSNGGRSEAERLCDMLNDAWVRFHQGE